MKWLLVKMLKHRVKIAKRAEVKFMKDGCTIMAQAYRTMIEAYESSILFLNAERKQ
jgi:hypothetical protein